MPIDQIIEHDNGGGTVRVTVITSNGNSETRRYDKTWPNIRITDTINEAVERALDKDERDSQGA